MVPSLAFPPATPFTDHVTPVVNVPVPFTVAANCCIWPGVNVDGFGVTETLVTVFSGGGGLGGFGATLRPPPQATVRTSAKERTAKSRE